MALPPFVYSPFARRWDELDATDLEQLKRAAEGWHVEYKRETPKADVAGKSLSSFANSYGGWIFYGVETPSGGSSFPTSFPGIADADVPRVLEMLQKGCTQVRPPPFFETKVIVGPDTTTGLPVGHSIVAVRVPPGAKAPYVHNNGRIYRRVSDSSEPTHETDRHVLDLLWERSNEARTRWRDLVTQDFEVSKAEDDQPLVHVFLTCDPYGDRDVEIPIDFHQFVDLMREPKEMSGGLPFDNFYTGPYCYIARQTAKADPYNLTLTWRQRVDGTAIVSFPLQWAFFNDGKVFDWLERYQQVDRFREGCEKARLTKGRVLDLNILAHVLSSIFTRYRFLLREWKIPFDFYACVRIDNVWRSVPFIDLPEYADFVEKYGTPLVQQHNLRAPESVDGMWPFDNWQDDPADRLWDSLTLFIGAVTALGVWLEPKAVLRDWHGLSERCQKRA